MTSRWIKNYEALATTKSRRDILAIAEAGLTAIETSAVIKQNVRIKDQELRIKCGQESQKMAQEYSIDHTAQNLLKVYTHQTV